jgi:hypothetical protein
MMKAGVFVLAFFIFKISVDQQNLLVVFKIVALPSCCSICSMSHA